MHLTALLLSRLQFAFTISFHIIFPSFTIGLGAWLVVLEAVHLITGRHVYRPLYKRWPAFMRIRDFPKFFFGLTQAAVE
jgi:cytochrome bd ubiquinol oxidase subunit I